MVQEKYVETLKPLASKQSPKCHSLHHIYQRWMKEILQGVVGTVSKALMMRPEALGWFHRGNKASDDPNTLPVQNVASSAQHTET